MLLELAAFCSPWHALLVGAGFGAKSPKSKGILCSEHLVMFWVVVLPSASKPGSAGSAAALHSCVWRCCWESRIFYVPSTVLSLMLYQADCWSSNLCPRNVLRGQGPCDNWLAWLAVLKLMTTAKPQHQMHCWQVLVTRCYMMLLVCWKLHIGMKNPENCPRLLQSGTTILGYLVSSSVNLERWWMSPLCGRCLWYSQNLPVESAAGLGTFCAGRRS